MESLPTAQEVNETINVMEEQFVADALVRTISTGDYFNDLSGVEQIPFTD